MKPENRKPVERRQDGTVAKGYSLNPGGRPKGYAEFREACRERSPRALAALERALDDEKLCVQAAVALLQHAWGRPPAAPEDLEALREAGPLTTREVAIAALEALAKEADD